MIVTKSYMSWSTWAPLFCYKYNRKGRAALLMGKGGSENKYRKLYYYQKY